MPGVTRHRRMAAVLRLVGVFCIVFSLSMLPPLAVSLWYGDGEVRHFLLSLGIIFLTGVTLWAPGRLAPPELRRRDGFLVVALFWTVLSALGALPFILGPHVDFVDALFEAASGFTTTGATVLTGLDTLPRSVLFYRQELQWFGGMGLIVLAVAVLPALGVGGMQLYRAEVPGPMKEDKLTPRLRQTAQALWLIYLGLTAACALGFWFAGMSVFDAVAHSMATLSTGGFSTHDASIGYFHSPAVEAVAIVFMLAGGINFAVHFLALHRRSLHPYWQDVEVRAFLLFVAAAIGVCTLALKAYGFYDFGAALRYAAFEAVSVITSTGFGTADFSAWPAFLPVLLIFVSFVGGCGGSTAGGMKVMRVLVLVYEGLREVRRLVHPRAHMALRLGHRVVDQSVAQNIWGFFAVYIATFAALMLAMMLTGLDQATAFSAVATCMNNLGPGLGEVAYDFAGVPDAAKAIAVFAMLAGRLEVFTLLVLLTPEYWKE